LAPRRELFCGACRPPNRTITDETFPSTNDYWHRFSGRDRLDDDPRCSSRRCAEGASAVIRRRSVPAGHRSAQLPDPGCAGRPGTQAVLGGADLRLPALPVQDPDGTPQRRRYTSDAVPAQHRAEERAAARAGSVRSFPGRPVRSGGAGHAGRRRQRRQRPDQRRRAVHRRSGGHPGRGQGPDHDGRRRRSVRAGRRAGWNRPHGQEGLVHR